MESSKHVESLSKATESPAKYSEAPSKALHDGTDLDFIWEDYLEYTKSAAVPPTAFSHVEYSLETGFKVGMKLEVPTPDAEDCYWLASIVMTCGPLLFLRYAGYDEDRSADFWFNIKSKEFHPVGWASLHHKTLHPPKGVCDRHQEVSSLLKKELKNVNSIPTTVSEDLDAGIMPIDQIKCGMKLEITEEFNCNTVWIATIVQNVGGRLLLRYDGVESSMGFWLFYLSERVHTVGYAFGSSVKYSPPEALKEMHPAEKWEKIRVSSLKEAEDFPFPAHVLEPQLPLEMHGFKQGQKLEAVDPRNYSDLCPATVSKVVNDYYFHVTIDYLESQEEVDNVQKRIVCCHANCQFIFPINWAKENGLQLKMPQGYKSNSGKFDWEEYLLFCGASPVPEDLFAMNFMNLGFDKRMKLEVASPFSRDKIYVSTIESIVDPLMWVHFDCNPERLLLVSMNAFDIYPVGWCAGNAHPLQTPKVTGRHKAKVLLLDSPTQNPSDGGAGTQATAQKEQGGGVGKSWCPKIYFNHRCFTGPLLSKRRLAEVPRVIGPGPMALVMKEVLTRLVSIAYKSTSILQQLMLKGRNSPDMLQLVIKAKHKGKSYWATVESVQHSEAVAAFCRQVCATLECCPHLFGPKYVSEVCPDACHMQTKTRYGYSFAKKHKKPGRPLLLSTMNKTNNATATTSSAAAIVRKGPGRKHKRQHWKAALKLYDTDRQSKYKADDVESDREKCDDQSENYSPPRKLKSNLSHTSRYTIVTRVAKLPNFGLVPHVSPFPSRRGRPRTRPLDFHVPLVTRRPGRPVGTTKKAQSQAKKHVSETLVEVKPRVIQLSSNPLHWSVEEVHAYIKGTNCAPLASLLREQKIDGQALLMLTLPSVLEFLHLKMELAVKFCHLVKSVKMEFFTHFVDA